MRLKPGDLDTEDLFIGGVRVMLTPENRERLRKFIREAGASAYLLRHPWEPWVKVGIAENVKRRMASYATGWGCPVPTPVVASHKELFDAGFKNAKDFEARMLLRFKSAKVQGEWLRLTPEVEDAIAMVAEKRWLSVSHLLDPRSQISDAA